MCEGCVFLGKNGEKLAEKPSGNKKNINELQKNVFYNTL